MLMPRTALVQSAAQEEIKIVQSSKRKVSIARLLDCKISRARGKQVPGAARSTGCAPVRCIGQLIAKLR
jgi:hypothetical protein